jgi:hypothetical protein
MIPPARNILWDMSRANRPVLVSTATEERGSLRIFPIRPGIYTIYIMPQFVSFMTIITPSFENRSRKICRAGVHKTQASLFLKLNLIHVAPHYGKSFFLIFWGREFWFSIGIYVNISNNWFSLYRIEFRVNVGIIIWLCLLIGNWFIYPEEHNTLRLCIHLFSTTYSCHSYLLKSWRIATIWVVKGNELDCYSADCTMCSHVHAAIC